MTDIEKLKKLEAKATRGPWSTHLVDDTTIISPAREVATTCDSAQTEREDGYNVEYEQMEADAALIVAMRNALPALLDAASSTLTADAGDGELIARLEEHATDWDGRQMPDLEPAKGDPTAGTLRKAAARLRSLAGEVERLERWKKHLHEQVDDFANRYAQAGQAAGQLRVDLRAAESERDALAKLNEIERNADG